MYNHKPLERVGNWNSILFKSNVARSWKLKKKRRKKGLIIFPPIYIYICLVISRFREDDYTENIEKKGEEQSIVPRSIKFLSDTDFVRDKVGKRKKFLICHAARFSIAQREPINDDFRLRGPTLKKKDQREQCHGTKSAQITALQ